MLRYIVYLEELKKSGICDEQETISCLARDFSLDYCVAEEIYNSYKFQQNLRKIYK